MSPAITNHPLHSLAERIEAMRIRRDADAFARLLSGEGVPTLSREGDDPAEIIWYCISRYIQPAGPDWFDPLADLLQQLLEQLADVLEGNVHAVAQVNGPSFSPAAWGAFAKLPADDWERYEPYVYNLLLFNSLFPARQNVFGGLEYLYSVKGLPLPVVLNSRAIPLLRTALMAQQTDARLVEDWMNQFELACRQLDSRAERAEALTLWRALLLAPASGEHELDIDRIRRALEIALGNNRETEDSRLVFVHTALQQMAHSWGGTPHFWRGVFAPEATWSEFVRQIAQDVWPEAQDADAYLPVEDRGFWRQLGPGTRRIIRQAFRSDAAEWNLAFFDLFKDAVADRQKLQDLRQHLQAVNPKLSTPKAKLMREAEDEESVAGTGEEPLQRLCKRTNHAQYERVTRQIADIEHLLSKRDRTKALERYQQLLQRQTSSGTAEKYLAMTAANVAKLFLESGNKDIAEKIYRDAVRRYSNDVVVCCGLADVLKAQERYIEAETLYRETVSRFPNAVVARNGLADVLKAQERHIEAETLYRETVSRFPNDVVARSGLADVLKAQERYIEAETLYRETVSRFPNNAVARSGLADVLKAQERYIEAETLYRETVSRFPNDVVARCG
ncbi:MAG: tetratricopeptide repeat protein, partial [Sulfuricellaceae bacterium]